MKQTTTLDWLTTPVASVNIQTQQAAEVRQTQLTKPPGSLGRLEELAIRLAALQGTVQPNIERVQISIFAADHGVACEGVSAFPQSVTSQMIKNFAQGGGAINVVARALNAQLEIINLGTVHDIEPLVGVKQVHIGRGTANFLHESAMTSDQLSRALNVGRETACQAQHHKMQLLIGGEMGIGNTTSATALASILLKIPPAQLTGPGTGLNEDGIAHKISVIERALALHHSDITTPLEALCTVGGFEIAALTGLYICGAQLGIPILIDGFISSVAALMAENILPGCKNWFIYSHQSAEPGHGLVLQALSARPVVNLEMRLGEGSGAAVTVGLLRTACALHNEMYTFAEAQVSTKNS